MTRLRFFPPLIRFLRLPYKNVSDFVFSLNVGDVVGEQDCNAKLYDFSMISGGILADKTELLNQHIRGCYGYIDPDYVHNGIFSGSFTSIRNYCKLLVPGDHI